MMLKDGKFIREQPPIIGANFHKTESREYSEEELEWQETLLAAEEVQDQFDLAEIIIGVMLIIPAVLLVFLLIIGAFTDA